MVSKNNYVYVKRTRDIMFLTLYVNNVLLARNNLEKINVTKKRLPSSFEMKGMGEIRYVLFVKIVRNRPKRLLAMCQKAYILEHFSMHSSKCIDTPIEKILTLNLDQCPKIDDEKEKMSNVMYTA